jgi:hypothetical protein
MAVWPYTTQRWQRLRRMKLRVNPLCEICLKQKRIVPAVAVDHIVPVKAPGGEAYPALDWLENEVGKSLRDLERENETLRTLIADVLLENARLRRVS